tara:strand:- start:999 stop:1244 length:246 start_codon:yes stop_codon:yes gene_type:complete
MSETNHEAKVATFFEEFSSLIGVERSSISNNSKLDELEWDSMALISTMALIDEIFDTVISGDKLTECITIGDILALVKPNT